MTKIVFACKSNSCRSQMAEGWARHWIKRRRDELDQKAQLALDRNSAVVDACAPIDEIEATCDDKAITSLKLQKRNSRADIQRHLSTLDNVVIASVALDSSSVFECTTGQCCGDLCETSAQRKVVKAKAVKAMGFDGIDISAFVPKTIDEIMPSLVDPSAYPDTQANIEDDYGKTLEAHQPTIDELSGSYSSTLLMSETEGIDDAEKKIVDKLIVMCSCGDVVKRRLARRSKSVEEWNIDAPTAASKSGEGDYAYRRVSLEIRKEVDILMNSLLLEDDEVPLMLSPMADEKKC